ncbi:conjugation system SOS inhibitor PsiB [Salmonella enterica]|uniref:conjugation system SOS inhibitor PsiB family protein n=1 Tax=Salmonella enterica TaxID=28901 RepID=UPI0003BD4CE1|nr:conjugation system SOS inhibitor PsiB family protein [Salmonella enterica]EAW2151912.1 conjugation system SOS inhibitor PsiB [Salmonella enterica subsp. enterica]EBM0715659.1 conjugation system SOS inhibitor PsiB [Salmonella enterica subsp. enterica serovar Agona]EBW8697275.1 conjugation system SOS inhibitor PsiB [Salmonella enterica subsp. diarizonae serovar 16:z10:e,n,x,z15]ESH02405.1 plasmid SOS inhibition protein B [Salmonella enterica subsp. enterica serovar Gaminara str. ATCC BAA-711]
MKFIGTLLRKSELDAMSADELEQFAERGQDYRHVLSCSVLNALKVPQGCIVEAEYASEFGGLYPVTIRFAPEGEFPAVEWYVSSAGTECDGWSVCRVDSAGRVTDLYYDTHFLPDHLNALLAKEAQHYQEVSA